MPNCDFYAVGRDFVPILDFIFAQAGWILVESASRHDQSLRRFSATDDVLRAFDLEHEIAHFMLYAPETRGSITEESIVFKPGAVRGATGRTDARGWGLVQLYLNPGKPGRVGRSHTNCNSEKRARAWEITMGNRLGAVDDWDMSAVQRVSVRLNRRIRRLGVQKQGSAAVLPLAAELAGAGAALGLA